MSKKNSKAARRRRHLKAVQEEEKDAARRKKNREQKAANRVRRASSIMAEESQRVQMAAAAAAVPDTTLPGAEGGSDAALMPPPQQPTAAPAPAPAPAAASDKPRLMKKPQRRAPRVAGAELLMATFGGWGTTEDGEGMDLEAEPARPRERRMSKSFEASLRFDAISMRRGPSKSIRKRAKGPKAQAQILARLAKSSAKRAKAMQMG